MGEEYGGLNVRLAERLGLFSYDSEYLDFTSFSSRGPVPAQPPRLETLPKIIHGQIGSIRFDTLRFSDTERIPPAAHTSCAAWGDSIYLDIDVLTVRPLPGCEDQYREFLELHTAGMTAYRFIALGR